MGVAAAAAAPGVLCLSVTSDGARESRSRARRMLAPLAACCGRRASPHAQQPSCPQHRDAVASQSSPAPRHPTRNHASLMLLSFLYALAQRLLQLLDQGCLVLPTSASSSIWIERQTSDLKVGGSSPSWRTEKVHVSQHDRCRTMPPGEGGNRRGNWQGNVVQLREWLRFHLPGERSRCVVQQSVIQAEGYKSLGC